MAFPNGMLVGCFTLVQSCSVQMSLVYTHRHADGHALHLLSIGWFSSSYKKLLLNCIFKWLSVIRI